MLLSTERSVTSGKIKVLFSIPVFLFLFLIFSTTATVTNALTFQSSETMVFSSEETAPSFPGGEDKLKEYLSKNLYYPKLAQLAGIKGIVTVEFIVETEGTIKNVKVIKVIGAGCDEAARETVQKMPNWIPGTKNGKDAAISRFGLSDSFNKGNFP